LPGETRVLETRIESPWNPSFFERPRTRAAYEATSEAVGKDDSIVAQQLKEIGPFIFEQTIGVYMPSPCQYIMWWPWVQNFHGEVNMGYSKLYSYLTFIWYDESLKESMGY
jgi:peptide/nickel transport system substrate-binding protein